jgi:hypothetical protein
LSFFSGHPSSHEQHVRAVLTGLSKKELQRLLQIAQNLADNDDNEHHEYFWAVIINTISKLIKGG